jgi:hypothetical protein
MMEKFQVLLEQAAFAGCLAEIKTKDRGVIVGDFIGVDAFDTDEDRYGFFIDLENGWGDSVYLDEIVDIKVIPKADTTMRAVV